jgi:predicted outer membrane protein
MANLRIVFVLASAGALTVTGCGKDEPRETGRAEAEMTEGGERAAAEDPERREEFAEANDEDSEMNDADQTGEALDARDESAGAKTTVALTENEIARVADVMSTGEVEQAQLALSKAQDKRVREYAKEAMKDHREAKQEGAKVVEKEQLIPQDGALATQLQNDAQESIQTLRDAQGSEFDRLYMRSQIEQHEKFLDVIDKELIPSARSEAIKDQLDDRRGMVENHLKEARQIQEDLLTGPGR